MPSETPSVHIPLMRARKSWRTFTEQPIEAEKLDLLRKFLSGNSACFFGTKLRFQLLEATQAEKEEIQELATYGVIKGAKYYIAGAAQKGKRALEDYGYAMEKNILFCEELGLSTCWLGATFDRSAFGNKIGLKDSEGMPAVTPVGYAEAKRRIKDRAMRVLAGSDSRLAPDKLFFSGSFAKPLALADAGKYGECLEMVRIGPSASNKQPWRVVKEEGKNVFHFFLEPTPAYMWPEGQHIDMGIAMCHFELACTDLGLGGTWVEAAPQIDARSREYVVTWEGL